ncbi:MAG TPA: ribonuclease P protein component 4 [Candidatus Saccharimonadales bacterium]|nr:ribonuclease P protein component 4 [Candidatus Saccharimonadales bacterium]
MAWKSANIREIARERITILIQLAKQVAVDDPGLSKRYLEISRLIGMKAGVRLPKTEKMFICKGCGSLLIPGTNCRVRIRPEHGATVLITCLDCGRKKRYPTLRERLSKQAKVN